MPIDLLLRVNHKKRLSDIIVIYGRRDLLRGIPLAVHLDRGKDDSGEKAVVALKPLQSIHEIVSAHQSHFAAVMATLECGIDHDFRLIHLHILIGKLPALFSIETVRAAGLAVISLWLRFWLWCWWMERIVELVDVVEIYVALLVARVLVCR